VFGSLTLGGYDMSKFIENNVTWEMSEDFKDLTVQIETITMSDKSTTSSLLPTPITAFLDSSFPTFGCRLNRVHCSKALSV
jgi:hypothetical protein